MSPVMYVDKPESEIFCQITLMSVINDLLSARYFHCSSLYHGWEQMLYACKRIIECVCANPCVCECVCMCVWCVVFLVVLFQLSKI